MRTSQFLLATTKETPTDAEIISHQLILRAGLVRKLASGLYSWLPTGVRVLQKLEAIIREEMNKAGALELLMPVVQPAELWQESGRFEQYGPELLRFTDRHNRDFILGPTHEEVVTDIARREIKSYKQLPLNLYQIQTKFRDEIRPRFGIMRSREFIMKDAYSFHLTDECLDKTYEAMHQAYCKIFDRCGLDYRPVIADSGSIGGSKSHEFHVLADSGEDAIAFSDKSDFAANVEQAEAIAPCASSKEASQEMTTVDTPNAKTIEAVSNLLGTSPKQSVKTLIIEDAEQKIFAVILRGDHELNEIKLNKLPQVTAPCQFVDDNTLKQHTGAEAGSIGPVGLDIPLLVDHSAAVMIDFVCGANTNDQHYTGVNWERDLELPETVDVRNVKKGDPSPDKNGKLKIARGIEIGHIFQLGKKYSEALKAEVLDENGKTQAMAMGCYGIGVTRVIAATIEQNNDEKGILWPEALAPFTLAIVPINMHKSEAVKAEATRIYQALLELGVEVLLDDRNERPGTMFADMELIGVPHRITIGDRSLEKGMVEYKNRTASDSEDVSADTIIEYIKALLKLS